MSGKKSSIIMNFILHGALLVSFVRANPVSLVSRQVGLSDDVQVLTVNGSQDCEHEGQIYHNGDHFKDSSNPCSTCQCSGGDVSCSVATCPPPPEGCDEIEREGKCCPTYLCPIDFDSFDQTQNESVLVDTTTFPTLSEADDKTEDPSIDQAQNAVNSLFIHKVILETIKKEKEQQESTGAPLTEPPTSSQEDSESIQTTTLNENYEADGFVAPTTLESISEMETTSELSVEENLIKEISDESIIRSETVTFDPTERSAQEDNEMEQSLVTENSSLGEEIGADSNAHEKREATKISSSDENNENKANVSATEKQISELNKESTPTPIDAFYSDKTEELFTTQPEEEVTEASKTKNEEAEVTEASKTNNEEAEVTEASKTKNEEAEVTEASKTKNEEAEVTEASKIKNEEAEVTEASKTKNEEAEVTEASKTKSEEAEVTEAPKTKNEEAETSVPEFENLIKAAESVITSQTESYLEEKFTPERSNAMETTPYYEERDVSTSDYRHVNELPEQTTVLLSIEPRLSDNHETFEQVSTISNTEILDESDGDSFVLLGTETPLDINTVKSVDYVFPTELPDEISITTSNYENNNNPKDEDNDLPYVFEEDRIAQASKLQKSESINVEEINKNNDEVVEGITREVETSTQNNIYISSSYDGETTVTLDLVDGEAVTAASEEAAIENLLRFDISENSVSDFERSSDVTSVHYTTEVYSTTVFSEDTETKATDTENALGLNNANKESTDETTTSEIANEEDEFILTEESTTQSGTLRLLDEALISTTEKSEAIEVNWETTKVPDVRQESEFLTTTLSNKKEDEDVESRIESVVETKSENTSGKSNETTTETEVKSEEKTTEKSETLENNWETTEIPVVRQEPEILTTTISNKKEDEDVESRIESVVETKSENTSGKSNETTTETEVKSEEKTAEKSETLGDNWETTEIPVVRQESEILATTISNKKENENVESRIESVIETKKENEPGKGNEKVIENEEKSQKQTTGKSETEESKLDTTEIPQVQESKIFTNTLSNKEENEDIESKVDSVTETKLENTSDESDEPATDKVKSQEKTLAESNLKMKRKPQDSNIHVFEKILSNGSVTKIETHSSEDRKRPKMDRISTQFHHLARKYGLRPLTRKTFKDDVKNRRRYRLGSRKSMFEENQ